MAAADHLSPRLFHSTDADLKEGDLIQPGSVQGENRHSKDYQDVGHHDFVWASKYKPKAYFGNKHYEVEPTGLTEDYKTYETPGGSMTRMDSPSAQENYRDQGLHAHNVVSLAPLRVKGRVNAKGEPHGGK